MNKISIIKILFFVLIVLPVAIFLFTTFIIPLVIILLILSIFWSGKVFRFGTFRQNNNPYDGHWQEEKKGASEDYVDVESTVVEESCMDGDGKKITAALPENKEN